MKSAARSPGVSSFRSRRAYSQRTVPVSTTRPVASSETASTCRAPGVASVRFADGPTPSSRPSSAQRRGAPAASSARGLEARSIARSAAASSGFARGPCFASLTRSSSASRESASEFASTCAPSPTTSAESTNTSSVARKGSTTTARPVDAVYTFFAMNWRSSCP